MGESAGTMTGGEDDREVVCCEGRGLAPAPGGGGATKASEDAGRAITGRILIVGEVGAKANGGDGLVVAPGVELARARA